MHSHHTSVAGTSNGASHMHQVKDLKGGKSPITDPFPIPQTRNAFIGYSEGKGEKQVTVVDSLPSERSDWGRESMRSMPGGGQPWPDLHLLQRVKWPNLVRMGRPVGRPPHTLILGTNL